jgi:hypothetical protein
MQDSFNPTECDSFGFNLNDKLKRLSVNTKENHYNNEFKLNPDSLKESLFYTKNDLNSPIPSLTATIITTPTEKPVELDKTQKYYFYIDTIICDKRDADGKYISDVEKTGYFYLGQFLRAFDSTPEDFITPRTKDTRKGFHRTYTFGKPGTMFSTVYNTISFTLYFYNSNKPKEGIYLDIKDRNIGIYSMPSNTKPANNNGGKKRSRKQRAKKSHKKTNIRKKSTTYKIAKSLR